jgi:U3 small nucleolar RNA-associated protein 14
MSVKSQTKKEKATEKAAKSNIASVKHAKGESDSESDDGDEQDDQMVHKDSIAFSQRELVARAFANDDVVAEFEQDKMDEIEEDGDKVEDLTLPGWGEWAGAGVKKKKNNKKKIVKVTKGVDKEKRKDYKLKNVIINEKVNKKVTRFKLNYSFFQILINFMYRLKNIVFQQYLSPSRPWNNTSVLFVLLLARNGIHAIHSKR